MKLLALTSLLVLLNVAPLNSNYSPELAIPIATPISKVKSLLNIYEPLIDAVYNLETTRNPLAYNPKEEATGGLQIRPNRLKHFNDLTHKNYTLDDMYDINKAIEVFIYFTYHDSRGREIEPKSFEQTAKNWNGSGPKTIEYWDKVKKLIRS